MISLNETEKRQHLEWLSGGQLIQQAFYNVVGYQQSRAFDGYIHSSKLDWSRPYEKQFLDHLKGSTNHNNVSGYSRAGDLFHSDIQTILTSFWGNNGAYPEYRFKFDALRFQGTVDRIQLGTSIGNILLEFKTVAKVQRDKVGADAIVTKMFKIKDVVANNTTLADALVISPKFMDLFDNDIKTRLVYKQRELKAEEKHQTQMFTYLWALSNMIQFDWACLAYIDRDSYQILAEYWYPVQTPETQEKIQRAAYNFQGVHQCLMNYLTQLQNNGSIGQLGTPQQQQG